jgi:DNA-binding response OmpR family regulator
VRTVLLVEDEPEIVGLLADFLAADGFGVVSAATPDAAVDCLAAHDVAAVVLDVMLPGGSGFDVCRRIREQSDVPVPMGTPPGAARGVSARPTTSQLGWVSIGGMPTTTGGPR